MGMYDYIKFEDGYPDLGITKDEEFQTKDTESQQLDHYKITKEGLLMFRDTEKKWVKDKSSFLGGYLECTNEKWIEKKLTGVIDIICSRQPDYSKSPYRTYIEYSLFFEKGKLFKVSEL